MNFDRVLRRLGLKAAVVHRLPGRVRISIPGLKKIRPENGELVRLFIAAMPLPGGVDSLEPSFVTGNVLVKFDPGVVCEEQVMAHIDHMVGLMIKLKESAARLTKDDAAKLREKVTEALNENGRCSMDDVERLLRAHDVWQ